MKEFRYSQIEQQLVDALPEVRPAAEFYWKTEGEAGQDSGPYVFFEDLFARYVEVLLAVSQGPRRDELLRRAFAVVEQMIASADANVQNLAIVGLYEGRDSWWFKRAAPFIGSLAAKWLDEHQPEWRHSEGVDDRVLPEILDGYHVRTVVARELHGPGARADELPGTTYASGQLPDVSSVPEGPDDKRK